MATSDTRSWQCPRCGKVGSIPRDAAPEFCASCMARDMTAKQNETGESGGADEENAARAARHRHQCRECPGQFDHWEMRLERVPFEYDENGQPTFRERPHYYCPHCGATRWKGGSTKQHPGYEPPTPPPQRDGIELAARLAVTVAAETLTDDATPSPSSSLFDMELLLESRGLGFSALAIVGWIITGVLATISGPERLRAGGGLDEVFIVLLGFCSGLLALTGTIWSAIDLILGKRKKFTVIAGLILGVIGVAMLPALLLL